MDNVSQLLRSIVRPTGDASTDTRTYTVFYNDRTRTENYDSERIEIIGRLGEVVARIYDSISINESSVLVKTIDETVDTLSLINADPILLPFCEAKGITNSFRSFVLLIPLAFRDIKDLKAEFVVDPDVENEQMIVFNLSIKGTPEDILSQEKMFYARLRTLIKSQDRKYFSLVYSVT